MISSVGPNPKLGTSNPAQNMFDRCNYCKEYFLNCYASTLSQDDSYEGARVLGWYLPC